MNDVISTVSYDQCKDIPCVENLSPNGVGSKIIFSKEVYECLKILIEDTKKNNRENGCYLVGRCSKENDFTFYFDFFTSPFERADGVFANGAVSASAESLNQLNKQIGKYKDSKVKPCVIHFHTHNLCGYYEKYSDQDYHVYAGEAYKNRDCTYFGALSFPVVINNEIAGNGFNIVLAVEPEIKRNRYCSDFYSFPNVYYIDRENDICKVGSYERIDSSRLYTNKEELSEQKRIVKNYKMVRGSESVSAIEKNYSLNKIAKDTVVGYKDANNNFFFSNERNSKFTFPKINSISIR